MNTPPAEKTVKCYECNGTGRQQYLGTDVGTGAYIWEWWPCEHCDGYGVIVVDRTGKQIFPEED